VIERWCACARIPALFGGDADACFSHRAQRHSCGYCSRRFAAHGGARARPSPYPAWPASPWARPDGRLRRLWFMLSCCTPVRAPHRVTSGLFSISTYQVPTRFGATTMQTRPNPLCPFRHFFFFKCSEKKTRYPTLLENCLVSLFSFKTYSLPYIGYLFTLHAEYYINLLSRLHRNYIITIFWVYIVQYVILFNDHSRTLAHKPLIPTETIIFFILSKLKMEQYNNIIIYTFSV